MSPILHTSSPLSDGLGPEEGLVLSADFSCAEFGMQGHLDRIPSPLARATRGSSILIVSDDGASAHETSCVLQWAGAQILGPASHSHAALRLIVKRTPDCALVSLELRGVQSLNVPFALRDLNVPFVLVTSHFRRWITNEFANVAVLRKPVESFKAAAAVIELLNSRRLRQPELN